MPTGLLPGTGVSSGQRREGGRGWQGEPQTPVVSSDLRPQRGLAGRGPGLGGWPGVGGVGRGPLLWSFGNRNPCPMWKGSLDTVSGTGRHSAPAAQLHCPASLLPVGAARGRIHPAGPPPPVGSAFHGVLEIGFCFVGSIQPGVELVGTKAEMLSPLLEGCLVLWWWRPGQAMPDDALALKKGLSPWGCR